MKKIVLISLILFTSSLLYSQNKKDKNLTKKIESVSEDIVKIRESIDASFDKKTSKTLYKNILSKKELSILESDISRSEKIKYIDKIVENAKKDKSKYLMLSMVGRMQESILEMQFEKLGEIFKKFGYISKSRLEKLKISDELTTNVEELFLYIPNNKKKEILLLIEKEYNADRLNAEEFNRVRLLLEEN
ncbi:hypothetical protein [Aquimarina sp. MAR_2010_214]|uniref:hypothetical protein n=1 Tax=Aquimarina sp. MAR_2010_214 TaxID=1250026 RepID=UPI00117830A5|nr:hypothetical protein [Aquimarina sp. MAR_2010_214]